MSIIDPNGKDLSSTRQEETISYKVESVTLESNATPNDKLHEALAGARQMATMQLMMQAKQQAAQKGLMIPEESLRVQAMAEASKITDPFKMEPCAQAIFMMLAKEIESRDATIKSLTERIEKLENEWRPKTESSLADGESN